MMPGPTEIVVGLLGTAGLGAGALKLVETWLSKRRSPEEKQADAGAAARELMTAAAAIADGLMKGMRADIEALRHELARLNEAHDECERKAEEQARQIETLTQARRQDTQRIDSLLRQLQAPGATHPGGALSGALIEMDGGTVTVTKPQRRTRTRK